MPLWEWIVDVLGVVVLLPLLYILALVLRRRWIARDGGTFELSHRVAGDGNPGSGRGWVLGVGRYSGDLLEFFRIFSLSPRPRRRLDRATVTYLGQRVPQGMEVHAIYSGHVIIACSTPRGLVELALAPDALTGLLAWLEASPPGRHGLVL